MEAREQLLSLGRSTAISETPGFSEPLGSTLMEDEQTGEMRPLSKKERQRLKREARKAKGHVSGKKSNEPTASEKVLQIGNQVFYEGNQDLDDGFQPADANVINCGEDTGMVGSHVIAPVSTISRFWIR